LYHFTKYFWRTRKAKSAIILKEFDTIKSLLKNYSEKFTRIGYLKERTLALEKTDKQFKLEMMERRYTLREVII
jgi:hypothetical protein